MELTRQEIDDMFREMPSGEAPGETTAGAPVAQGSLEPTPDEPAPPTNEAPREPARLETKKESGAGGVKDDKSWLDEVVSATRPRNPVEQFEWLKHVRGFTARHDDPELGPVVAVAYFEIQETTQKRWFNCAVNGKSFLEADALKTFERRTPAGRFVVRLLPWKEGTRVRRWCRTSRTNGNLSGYDLTFVVRGQELVRKSS